MGGSLVKLMEEEGQKSRGVDCVGGTLPLNFPRTVVARLQVTNFKTLCTLTPHDICSTIHFKEHTIYKTNVATNVQIIQFSSVVCPTVD